MPASASIWLSVLLGFLVNGTYWAVKEVARDIEDPFVYDPTDLPLAHLQVGRGGWVVVVCVGGRAPSTAGEFPPGVGEGLSARRRHTRITTHTYLTSVNC